MIRTVTLNPALDKTLEINNFEIDDVNRVSSVRIDAGGKGINVSKLIKILGGRSKAFGILSGRNGDYIKEYLDKAEIENDFVYAEGETRTNLKIIDSIRHTNTDINEPGPYVPYDKIKELERKIFGAIGENAVLVLSGSIPKSVSTDIYYRWIDMAKKLKVRVVLDCDGELLKKGIKAEPYLIKPNINELEELLGRKVSGMDDMIKSARELLRSGIEVVVLSLGSDGALFVKDGCIIHAKGVRVDVKSTVGAGDSMVAALAFALDEGMSFEKAAALSAAAGTAKVTTSGSQPPSMDKIMSIERLVKLDYIK
ncbi:MAG TPA: 1-phosphofructokinase [Clostridiaceae bacterium]|nr:1-phosphofructokinase [Clostridiaceae bacterium]